MKDMDRSGPAVLAFDIGGTKLKSAVVQDGQILAESKTLWPKVGGEIRIEPDELISQLLAVARPWLKQYSIKAIGVASAGPLNSLTGELLSPTNMRSKAGVWGQVPVTQPLKDALHLPVCMINDAAASAVAEVNYGFPGTRNLVSVTLGTGVGVGVVIEGELLKAGRGLHPELSHIPIDWADQDGLCGCGWSGCLEVYLSGAHFTRWAGQQLGREESSTQLITSAQSGSLEHLELFRRYASRFAQAMGILSATFAPEVLVLGGSFAAAAQVFLPMAEPLVLERLKSRRIARKFFPSIQVSRLGDLQGVLGAAALAEKTLYA